MKPKSARLTYPILIAFTLAAACTEDTGAGDGDSEGDGDANSDMETGGTSSNDGTGGADATGKAGSSCQDVSDCFTGLVCSMGKCQDPQEAVLSCVKQCGPSECVAENLACDAQAGCMDVVECQFACKASDASCQEACIPEAITQPAVDALDGYYACIVEDCEACITIGDTGSGGGSSSGGSSSGGAGTGGDTSSGGVGGGGTLPAGCGTVTYATGAPEIIDNFDHANFPNFPDEGDGRVGTWEHQYWAHLAPANSIAPIRIDDEDENGHIQLSCIDESWCNTEWDEEYPWEQWAALSTLFGEYSEAAPNCYDASIYTGIRFDARSLLGEDLILVQMATPESDADLGWNYKSFEYLVGADWDGIEIPFSTIIMPSWVATFGGPSGAVNPEELISMSFVVRTVQSHTFDLEVLGENLLPYDIEIDNLRFY